MPANDGQGGENDKIDPPFLKSLSELKSNGAALLIVGDLPPSVYAQACHQMMGGHGTKPRRQLFVSTGTGRHAQEFCTGSSRFPHDPTRTRFIRYETDHRSTATVQSPTDTPPETTVVDGEYSTLGIEISKAIEEFGERTGELRPAELRLCFDSLVPLVSAEHKPVFKFLVVLIGRLKSVNGMGHFHLSRPRSAEVVSLLEPLFDAVIELRLSDGDVQQRWHLRDESVTTPWISPNSDTE